MISWNEVTVEQERRRSEIAAAEVHRHHRHALSLLPRQISRYEHFLGSIGSKLIVLGQRLEARALLLTEGEEYVASLMTDPLNTNTPSNGTPC